MKKTNHSAHLFEEAKKVLVGGVNSPVRAYKAVGGTPTFFVSGEGAYVEDADGKPYVDFVQSWGPVVLGHRHPAVVQAIQDQLEKGMGFGAPHPAETTLAQEIIKRVPGVDRVRLVTSGTEATMSALRLARAVTGREIIIKVEGGYHGHGDSFLVKAGSGALTFGNPSSPGVPKALAKLTRVAQFNNLASFEAIFKAESENIAAVIVETIPGNCGVLPPDPAFLKGLRKLCTKDGALLILDEVMCGFRTGNTAAERYGVQADLYTLGKIIGGGLPLAAYAGPAKIMDQLSPSGPVYQAGTLSGNPVAVAAGLATLKELTPAKQTKLETLSAYFETELRKHLDKNHTLSHVTLNRAGSMFTLFFCPGPVKTWADASKADTAAFNRFFHLCLEAGFNLPPSQFEAFFVSLAMDKSLLKTCATVMAENVLKALV